MPKPNNKNNDTKTSAKVLEIWQ